jgi:hypothetical protein
VSVLIIRAHKRFAICSKAKLRKPGKRGVDALLIELSLDGCRLSNIDAAAGLALEDKVVVRIAGASPLEARIRWLREGTAGLRFVRPLHVAALDALIRLCRGETETAAPQRAYGT